MIFVSNDSCQPHCPPFSDHGCRASGDPQTGWGQQGAADFTELSLMNLLTLSPMVRKAENHTLGKPRKSLVVTITPKADQKSSASEMGRQSWWGPVGVTAAWCYSTSSAKAWLVRDRVCLSHLQVIPNWKGTPACWETRLDFRVVLPY